MNAAHDLLSSPIFPEGFQEPSKDLYPFRDFGVQLRRKPICILRFCIPSQDAQQIGKVDISPVVGWVDFKAPPEVVLGSM